MAEETTVTDRLARIEVKLDQALTQHGDHETRIRRLERALWAAAGAGGVVGAIVTKLTGGG